MINKKEIEFDKFVQDRYEQHEVIPPDNLWNTINSSFSDSGIDNFDKQIEKRFTGHETKPPLQLWDKVNIKAAAAKTSMVAIKSSILGWIGITSISIITIIGLVYIFSGPEETKEYNNIQNLTDDSVIIPKDDNLQIIDYKDTISEPQQLFDNRQNTPITLEPDPTQPPKSSYNEVEKYESKQIPEDVSKKDTTTSNGLEYSEIVRNNKKEEVVISNSQLKNTQLIDDSILFTISDNDSAITNTEVVSEYIPENHDKSKKNKSINNRTNGKIEGPYKTPKKEEALTITNITINNENYKNTSEKDNLNNDPKVNGNSKLSLQAVLSASYSDRKLSSSDSKGIAEYYNKVQDGNWNMVGGISLGYNINEKWMVLMGVSFNQLNQSFHNLNMHPSKMPNLKMDGKNNMITVASTLGTGIAKNLYNFKFAPPGSDLNDIKNYYNINYKEVHQFKFIYFPLTARYTLGQKKLVGLFEAGITASVVIDSQTSISISTVKDAKEVVSMKNYHKVNKFGLGIIISTGVQYKLSKKVSAIVIPTLQYSLTNLSKENNITLTPYSLSISAGINYKF